MIARNNKVVYVAVFGAGVVESCVLRQLAKLMKDPSLPALKLCYMATIDGALYKEDYSDIDISTALEELAKTGRELPPISFVVDYLSEAPGKLILVDNTSANTIAEAYPLLLSRGVSIATPNKKAFSGNYQLWQDIFSAADSADSYVYHESSVGAGMPIISTLKDFVQTGDRVKRIEGVFSGTMSFLFNSFSPIQGTGGKWSTIVKEAKELGFTEPDPRDDLNGLDVARKMTILARLSGLPIKSATSFPVQSLIPKELDNVRNGNEFLKRLSEFDYQMESIKAASKKEGKVLRFVGSADLESQQVKVGLEMFDPSHPIARLKGSGNIISFHTERYGSAPLIVQGAGAGGEVTAMGVTSDVIKILHRIS